MNTMKMRLQPTLLSLLFIFSTLNIAAQKKLFFNVNDVKCKEKTAHYYRMIVPQGSLFRVTEYFIEGNQMKMEGQYKSKKLEYDSRDGDFNWYYCNGQKRIEGHYKGGKATDKWTYYYKDGQIQSEGSYVKDNKDGEWGFYHRNGAVKVKPNYIDGDIDGVYAAFYDNGDKKSEFLYKKGKADGDFTIYFKGNKVKSKGTYLKDSLDGAYERYFIDGKLAFKGEYNDNKRSGTWEFFHQNGNKSAEVDYNSKGKFTKGTFFDEDGKKLSKKVTVDDLFKDAEYPGGKDEMYKEINSRLGDKLDFKAAKAEKYTIVAYCILSIDEDGNITERRWEIPDGDDDDNCEDKFDVVKFINSSIDDFPKFKAAKAYNRNYEDEVIIYYNIDFSKL
jgi:antitoxin component YwqK of YwqJK toxin-antitoxin module